jgi:hypothetical protein
VDSRQRAVVSWSDRELLTAIALKFIHWVGWYVIDISCGVGVH